MISRARGGSAYQQAAAAIRARIASGEFPPGSQLPSEAYLAHEYGVGRDTLRKSIAVLRFEGAIVSGGSGQRWVVAEPSRRESVWVHRGSSVVSRPPTDEEREQFGIDPAAAIWVLEIHHTGEDVRVLRADRFVIRFE